MSRFAMFPKERRMVTCRRVGQLLQAYLDGEADDLTARRLAHHLDACRRCGLELETYTQIKASLRQHPDEIDHDALHRLQAFGQGLVDRGDDGERLPEA